MKYARKGDSGTTWIDVFNVPGDFPDLSTLNRCLPGFLFQQVDPTTLHGDFVGPGDTTVARPPAPVLPRYAVLTRDQLIPLFPVAMMKSLQGSTVPTAVQKLAQFNAKATWTYDDASALADTLIAAGVIQTTDKQALQAAWPMA